MSESFDRNVYIVAAVRTPIGSIGGSLRDIQARPLATHIISELLRTAGIAPELVDYTAMGWVMQDPRSPNLAKSAAEFAGVPNTRPGTTIHENCASGGAAIHDIARRILLGEIETGVAGGVESMSNVPRYLYECRNKSKLYGDITLSDGVMGALTDLNVGPKGELMGYLTERLVEKYHVTREEQDEVAYNSHHNALNAWANGMFSDYVRPVPLPGRKGQVSYFDRDEGPRAITREELAAARPYFKPDGGTITAINSSSINDAAAAVLLMSARKLKELGCQPLARLMAYHNVGVPRELMGEGAFKVIPGLLTNAGLTIADIDYFELNEAFAAVVAAGYHDLPGLAVDRTNQWGSGISLGHPVGCTGARQVVDMVHQLRKRGKRLGVTSRCVGGGIGSGEVIEIA